MQDKVQTAAQQDTGGQALAQTAEMAREAAVHALPDAAKAALRTRLLAVRTACAGDAPGTLALAAQVMRLLMRHAPHCVAFYWPLPGEFDLRELIGQWLAGDPARRAALPVVDAPRAPLSFHAWHAGMPMQPGRYRIPVPALSAPVQPDMLLIPCVGFDRSRRRLGYGGGFYDRTLAACAPRPLAAGIAWDATGVPALPHDRHDVPLDVIVTESGWY